MKKKLLSMAVKGFNDVTSVKFILGFLTGCGTIVIMLGNAVGMF